MQPVVDAAQLARADAVAIADHGLDALVEKAGFALAMGARRTLGRTAGVRVVVWCGPGLNGADGRVAARVLRRFGAAVRVVDLDATALPEADLVIDAGFGTGVRRPVVPPRLRGTPIVIAADLPSGVDPATGAVHGQALAATATVTFGALKPGLCFGEGSRLAGAISVAPLGLTYPDAKVYRVGIEDLDGALHQSPLRHKWTTAVGVLGGSTGMLGAPGLVARAALRSGAGMARVLAPTDALPGAPEAVVVNRSSLDARAVLAALERCTALVVGPGLGKSPEVSALVRTVLLLAPHPVVLDADGLGAFSDVADLASVLQRRPSGAVTVLTPHDGEYRALMGALPSADRLAAARALATASGATVLLKGPTTAIVPSDDGPSYLVTDAPASLATAGTGDVLAGLLGALLGRTDLDWTTAHRAGVAAAWHGAAGRLGYEVGCLSSDVADLIAEVASRRSVDHGG